LKADIQTIIFFLKHSCLVASSLHPIFSIIQMKGKQPPIVQVKTL